MAFTRQFVTKLYERIAHEDTPLIQVVLGPRQVGKTTGVQTVLERVQRSHYANADLARAPSREWIIEQWQAAKALGKGTVLALDEIQKIDRWSDVIKGLYDADRASGAVKVIVMGSASLTLREGLGESLLGRFEVVEVPHWSFWESKAAFGWNLNQHRWLYSVLRKPRFRSGTLENAISCADIQRTKKAPGASFQKPRAPFSYGD
jgi:predicted AAA+ superfamily ATPase